MSDRITVVGNVASSPERRELPGGVPAVSFRLASSERRLENGQWVDGHTNWYWVSAYRKLAEHALDSLEKGQRVIVTGKFRLKQWESAAKSGSSAEIDADAVGHDLMFGTTTFHKSTASTAPRPSTPAPESSGWAVPGSDGVDAPAHLPVADDADARADVPAGTNALVGAGGWAPAGDEETPF